VQHYADDSGRAAPHRYAKMVAEDRKLRLRGYEVDRFGGDELRDKPGTGKRPAGLLRRFGGPARPVTSCSTRVMMPHAVLSPYPLRVLTGPGRCCWCWSRSPTGRRCWHPRPARCGGGQRQTVDVAGGDGGDRGAGGQVHRDGPVAAGVRTGIDAQVSCRERLCLGGLLLYAAADGRPYATVHRLGQPTRYASATLSPQRRNITPCRRPPGRLHRATFAAQEATKVAGTAGYGRCTDHLCCCRRTPPIGSNGLMD
jgi:hypothetical protein